MTSLRSLGWIIAMYALLCVCFIAESPEAVQIEEWTVPTPLSLPHDPAVAPDGSLWYTGMYANKIGRLDPKTGVIKEYPLKTDDSGPHGLVADKDGFIWFTANYKGYIGKLNPANGEITEFRMPDPAARDPHTPVFDRTGILWFTVQNGNSIGRLDPKNGTITLTRSLTANSRPYGIVINAAGIPFYCELGSNKIANIDPTTLKITEYLLPEGARPRRLDIGIDDTVYYTDYARGYLGRLNVKTGNVDEWPSPGGPQSKPYGIAITPDGTVWYSEAGVAPNTMIRFDPKTGGFSSWKIPSGGGVVRHMVSTPSGDIYFASSGANKVGIIRTAR